MAGLSETRKRYAIVGPTASGKTALSVALAKRLDAEIIGMDSMQIYRHLDIGTAKATAEEMQGIPHHMIDMLAPELSFSVSAYREAALACVENIERRGKRVVFCGGTGLYLQSMQQGMHLGSAPENAEVRAALEAEYRALGAEALHALLAEVDRESARRIHPNDMRRVVRALEVFAVTGTPKSAWRNADEGGLDIAVFGLYLPREVLYERINARVDAMMEAGLLEEAIWLHGYFRERGIEKATAAQAIGYKELFAYLEGAMALGEAVSLIKQRSRNYAKRQMTWFKKQSGLQWLDALEIGRLMQNPLDFFPE